MSPEELFLRRSQNSTRKLIVAGVCVLLLIIFYFLVVSDMMAQIDKLQAQIGRTEIEIINQKKILADGTEIARANKGTGAETPDHGGVFAGTEGN